MKSVKFNDGYVLHCKVYSGSLQKKKKKKKKKKTHTHTHTYLKWKELIRKNAVLLFTLVFEKKKKKKQKQKTKADLFPAGEVIWSVIYST